MNANLSKARRKLQPAVEGLESLRLLSGLAHPVAHVAAIHAEATKAPAQVAVVNLHGTIRATGKIANGTTLVLAGSGNLGAVGTASIKVTANLLNPPSTVTLSTKKGQIILAEQGSASLANNGGSSAYTVIGGTGSYAHTTGSGSIVATYSLAKGNKVTASFKFS